jgi:hypothetical protein
VHQAIHVRHRYKHSQKHAARQPNPAVPQNIMVGKNKKSLWLIIVPKKEANRSAPH